MSNPFESKPPIPNRNAKDWWAAYDRGFLDALKAARVTLFGMWLTLFLMLINFVCVVYQIFKNYQP